MNKVTQLSKPLNEVALSDALEALAMAEDSQTSTPVSSPALSSAKSTPTLPSRGTFMNFTAPPLMPYSSAMRIPITQTASNNYHGASSELPTSSLCSEKSTLTYNSSHTTRSLFEYPNAPAPSPATSKFNSTSSTPHRASMILSANDQSGGLDSVQKEPLPVLDYNCSVSAKENGLQETVYNFHNAVDDDEVDLSQSNDKKESMEDLVRLLSKQIRTTGWLKDNDTLLDNNISSADSTSL